MTAQCVKCGRLYNWSAQRGSRLSEAECADCHGKLELSIWIHGERIGKKTGKKGWWKLHTLTIQT